MSAEFQDEMLSKYVIVPEMPTSGNFAAIWQFGGKIFSSSFTWDVGTLYVYDEAIQSFVICQVEEPFDHHDGIENLMFIKDISENVNNLFH